MNRFGTLSLATLLAAVLVTAGSTTVRADDGHGKLHRKLDRQHESYHRKQGGPPYGRAVGHRKQGAPQYGRVAGHHTHSPSCGHDIGYRPSYGGGYDAQCGHILARAQKARDGLRRWEGTGRHRDAVRAWHEILQRTPQKLAECRHQAQARRYDGRYDDRYYDDYRYGDPYASGPYGGGSFELKRDWPFLLGGLLGQYSGQ